MTKNNVNLKKGGVKAPLNTKPTDDGRFVPADTEVSLANAIENNSADGLYETDNRFGVDFYEDRRYTAEDFADSLTVTNNQLLPAIPPRDGWENRWVCAIDDADTGQRSSYARAVAKGWKPRRLETIPKNFLQQYSSSGKASSKDMGIFQVAEMILMEMPTVRREMNRNVVRRKTQAKTESVSNFVSGSSPYGKNYSQMQVDTNEVHVTSGNKIPHVAD